MILVGDVGGTKTRLAVYERTENGLVRKKTSSFSSRNYSSVRDVADAFVSELEGEVDKACFGVPGPVIDGEAKATNLPWKVGEEEVRHFLGIEKVMLVNDLVAFSSSVPHLSRDDLQVLHDGKGAEDEPVLAVLAPGTGLGQAFLVRHSGVAQAYPSEGGHVSFAPTNETEIDLLKYLLSKHKRVSYERILCGPGLFNIYSFLKDTGYAPVPKELDKRLAEADDPAAVISSAALSEEFEICVRALDMFVSILGARAGDLVLSLFATGGIYLGGGIPPKISKKLSDGTIIRSYLNKGRLSEVVERTPLCVIKDDYAALLGAAHIASAL